MASREEKNGYRIIRDISRESEGKFIDESDSQTDEDANSTAHNDRTSISCKTGLLLCSIVNVVFFLSCALWALTLWSHSVTKRPYSCAPGPDLIHSPAREAVSYETVDMNNPLSDVNVYKGEPRPEQSQAWKELTRWRNIVVSKEDLDAIGQDSVELPDGSGYLAQIDVIHQLHCLNIVREYVHRDYYSSRETPEMRLMHVDHCIDTLRQILMCHGDIEVVTVDWVRGWAEPLPNFHVERECRNWDAILGWTKRHQADVSNLTKPI